MVAEEDVVQDALPKRRKEPPIPDVEEIVPETVDRYPQITETPNVDGAEYRVTVNYPARRTAGVLAELGDRHPEIRNAASVIREMPAATISVHVGDTQSAFAVLDAVYEAIGYCRVCGSADCMEGVVNSPYGMMHRSRAKNLLDVPEYIDE